MAGRQEDVLRLDVAMNQSMLVGILQRVSHFSGDANRVLDRELALALQPIPQRLALDERHDIEQELGGWPARRLGG
jgi:hypothetical protein